MTQKRMGLAGAAVVVALVSGAVAFTLGGCTKKPVEVVIGVQVVPNGEALAKAKGWYEKELGAKVTFKQFDSGKDVNTALAAKGIDIGLVGTTPAAVGISKGIPYDVFWLHDVIGDAEALVVKNKAGITAIKDLVGKKVAVPVSSTAHFSLLNALKLSGVNPADVKILDLQPPDILAAWLRGDIDAAYVWHPTLGKLFAADGKALINSQQLAEKGIVTAEVGVVRREFAEKHPDIVANYVRIQIKAHTLYKSDIKDTAETIAKAFAIEPAEALKQINGLVWVSAQDQLTDKYLGTSAKKGGLAQTLKSTADFLVEQKAIEAAPGLDAFQSAVNPKYIEAALK
jgi:taurine transport system substrate-binding protein